MRNQNNYITKAVTKGDTVETGVRLYERGIWKQRAKELRMEEMLEEERSAMFHPRINPVSSRLTSDKNEDDIPIEDRLILHGELYNRKSRIREEMLLKLEREQHSHIYKNKQPRAQPAQSVDANVPVHAKSIGKLKIELPQSKEFKKITDGSEYLYFICDYPCNHVILFSCVGEFMNGVFERFRAWDEYRANKMESLNAQRKQDEPEFSFQPHLNGSDNRKKTRMGHEEAMQKITFKNEQWQRKRQEKLKSMRDDLLAEELNECTFSPSIPSHPKNNKEPITKTTPSKAKIQVQGGSETNVEDTNKDSNENVARHDTPSWKEQSSDSLKNSVLLFSRNAADNAANTSPVAMHIQNSTNEKHDWIGDVEQHLNGEKEKYARNDADVDDVYVTDDLFA